MTRCVRRRCRRRTEAGYGVYQIGDVYARCCVIILTSFAILTLKRMASCAVQPGSRRHEKRRHLACRRGLQVAAWNPAT
jgi:hypothetical protein